MSRCIKGVFLLFLLVSLVPSASSQLRTFSPYNWDRINREKTYFVFHETGKAEFVWASEWNHATAYANAEKSAILVWHFKDGSKAYSEQGEGIGEFGKNTGYLIEDKSDKLDDIHCGKIQPLTLDNYPVKVELWIGTIDDSTGYVPEQVGDAVCFEADSIEYNTPYYFSNCK
jgi:hypothetical protein